MMPDRDAIERTLRAYAAAWAARDREGWLSTFADLATQEDPVGEGTRRGREEIGEFWDRAMSAYESIEIVPSTSVRCTRAPTLFHCWMTFGEGCP